MHRGCPSTIGGVRAQDTSDESDDPASAGTERGSPGRVRPAVADWPRHRVNPSAIFGLGSGSWGWAIGIKAAIAMAISFSLTSYLLSPQLATIASLGSMTVLYERTTPYGYRAIALVFVGLGFVASVTVGSLSAVNPWGSAVAVGAIAGVATWLCQALRVDRPGPVFFVLVGAIATIVPGGLAEVPMHAGIAALGAAVGWLVSMSGALLHGRHPENRAVAQAFVQLAALLRAVGTQRLDHVQHDASVAVAEAWRIMLLAQSRGYRDTPEAARLRALLRWVSDIHLAATEVSMARTTPLPDDAADFANDLAAAVARPTRAPAPEKLDEFRRGQRPRSRETQLYNRLSRAAQAAHRPEHENQDRGLELYDTRFPSVGNSLRSSLTQESLIRPTALRMAITVALAGVAGVALGMERFYWISITATTVLQGGNVVLIVNRSAQRALGTLLGVGIGAGLLLLEPSTLAVVGLVALFQGLGQCTLTRNFFYGTILITPMALLLAQTAAPIPVDTLAEVRVLDTFLGSVAGMLGAILLWRRASATRLPQTVADVLDQARATITAVLDPDVELTPERRYRLRRDLRAALLSLRGVYDSAIGDVPRVTTTRPLWPVVVATQRTGYLALAALAMENPPVASHITLQRLDLAFRELREALLNRRTPRLGALPRLVDYPRINLELRALSSSMRTAVAEDLRAAARQEERRAQRESRHAQEEIDADL